uniref:coiled-coil domain-containing protein 122 isoform X2 n=1 Tax=Pristiophorus japonicus TaxID=55135 RepID=UPI00398E5E65
MAGQSTQLSLSQIVKEVAQQQQQQAVEAGKNKNILSHLQAQLFEMEKENKVVLQEFRTTEKQIYHFENESESRRQHSAELEAQLWSLNADNLKLKFAIQEEEEKYFKLLSGYDKYRKKMLAHKELTNQLESRTPIMMELKEKILMVKELKAKKEELVTDLMNPEGNIIKQVQVQNKRCEAILKRLYCQLNKVQSHKRQLTWDMEQMEKTAAYLRQCLGITE